MRCQVRMKDMVSKQVVFLCSDRPISFRQHGGPRLRSAGHARLRNRALPRRNDGVSAGGDGQGLHVEADAGGSATHGRALTLPAAFTR